MISLVERGHLDRVSLRVVRRILAALDASAAVEVRWRGGALDRLLDEDHAVLVGVVADWLRRAGWEVRIEVTYSHYGERGSFDILAFHPDTGMLLVVEAKTDLASAESTLRKVDEKVRLGPIVARERFGWPAKGVSRLLVMPETSTLRRRVARHGALFESAFPDRGIAVRRWLDVPSGPFAGLWFLSANNPRVAKRGGGGRDRVRRPAPPSANHDVAA
jgi:hypothetical protein